MGDGLEGIGFAHADLALGSLLEHVLRKGAAKAPEVLVRGWDSGRDPERIVDTLAMGSVLADAIETGALVRAEGLDPGALRRHLHGFDEVWVGGRDVDWSALSGLGPLTPDRVRLTEQNAVAHRRGLLSCGAWIGMADGAGLNAVYRRFAFEALFREP